MLAKLKLFQSLICTSYLLVSCDLNNPPDEPNEFPTPASTIWIDHGPDVGQFSSLNADSKGNPHVSYYDYTLGDLKYAVLNSEKGVWEIQVVDQVGDTGLYTSLAIDSKDNPHILYYNASKERLKYAFFNGSKWFTTDAYADRGGLFASLALDANDVAHISFIAGGSNKLLYIKRDFQSDVSQPTSQELDSGWAGNDSSVNLGTSIRIRPDSQEPTIAYYNATQGALHVLSYDPKSENARTRSPAQGWKLDVVDGAPVESDDRSDVGEFASLFVANENEYHISYYDKTLGNLKYAHWNEKRWSTALVDEDGVVGEWTSITVVCSRSPGATTECKPYISYFDSTNHDLKVAVRSEESGWVTFRADPSRMTGTHSSITQVKRGRVGISYRDLTFSGLKFLIFFPF